MNNLSDLAPKRVFHYFSEISRIPRGSGNTAKIAEYCVSFALSHKLKYSRDDFNNVIIYKSAALGCENSEPIILQGHLDMVCQKTPESDFDFDTDSIDIYSEGDFIKARGTTLGADNGIAVAMILAILESDEYLHPPIEAVFTSDEEIGMLGALKLDMSKLHAKRMINLDEEQDVVTVSCAGGSDFSAALPAPRVKKHGTLVTLSVNGLKGGHSGIEIDKGRINADTAMGRLLDALAQSVDFGIISVNGGDKSNAIPSMCEAELCVSDTEKFLRAAEEEIRILKEEFSSRECGFNVDAVAWGEDDSEVLSEEAASAIISALITAPNGVISMSPDISGLVETSLNLGILKTEADCVRLGFSLRSSKKSARKFQERRLKALFSRLGGNFTTSGEYPSWEYNKASRLQSVFSDVYEKKNGRRPRITAIHAGLECGVFFSAIDGFDCIAIGPDISGAHTTEEKLSISSTCRLFDILTDTLKALI